MKFKVEFYPVNGSVPMYTEDDLLFSLEADAPFPAPDVGETVALHMDTQTAVATGSDYWVVERRAFIFWKAGSTAMYWCVPAAKAKKASEPKPERRAITSLADLDK